MDSNQKPSLKLDELLEKARARGQASAAESAAGHATPASEDKKAGGALAPDKGSPRFQCNK